MVPDENSITLDTSQHDSYPALQMDDAVKNHPSRKDSVIFTDVHSHSPIVRLVLLTPSVYLTYANLTPLVIFVSFFVLPT